MHYSYGLDSVCLLLAVGNDDALIATAAPAITLFVNSVINLL